MRDLLVYVAGPITRGGVGLNIGRACEIGIALLKAGIGAHVPHLTCYMGQSVIPYKDWLHNPPIEANAAVPELCPRDIPIETWYELSLIEVRRCDALIRLPGESRGSDMEEAEMRKLGRPVFYNLGDVIAWANDPSTSTVSIKTPSGISWDRKPDPLGDLKSFREQCLRETVIPPETRRPIPVKRNGETIGYAVETGDGLIVANVRPFGVPVKSWPGDDEPRPIPTPIADLLKFREYLNGVGIPAAPLDQAEVVEPTTIQGE